MFYRTDNYFLLLLKRYGIGLSRAALHEKKRNERKDRQHKVEKISKRRKRIKTNNEQKKRTENIILTFSLKSSVSYVPI